MNFIFQLDFFSPPAPATRQQKLRQVAGSTYTCISSFPSSFGSSGSQATRRWSVIVATSLRHHTRDNNNNCLKKYINKFVCMSHCNSPEEAQG